MSKRDRERKNARESRRRYTTYISSRPQTPKKVDYRSWPLVKAYVPVEDVWRGTGLGTAGIVRQRPDGTLITAFFNISLIDGGITGMMGKDETTLEEEQEFLDSLRHLMPPLTEGPADLAARYIWG